MSVEVPKIAGLVSSRYVVMSVLNRMNEYSMKQYLRLMQICLEGITEMNLFHTKESIEVVYLHMSTAKTCQLPADFIDYLRIGFPEDGKLRVITKHDKLLLPRTYYGSIINGVFEADTGDVVGNADAGNEQGTATAAGLYLFPPHYHGGRYVGALYGLPGGIDQAYYRIDIENRQIIFSGSTPRSEIVMEYISSGQKPDGSSLISREAVTALRTYILWQKDEYDPRIAYNAKARAKQEHEEAVEALRSLTNSFTSDEYLAMVRSSIHQSPKR
jgi:hypothetical protein